MSSETAQTIYETAQECTRLRQSYPIVTAGLSCYSHSHCRSRYPVWASGDSPARGEVPCRGLCRQPVPAPSPHGHPASLLSHPLLLHGHPALLPSHPLLPRAPLFWRMRTPCGYCYSHSYCLCHADYHSHNYYRSHCHGRSYFHNHSYCRTGRYRHSRSQAVTIK